MMILFSYERSCLKSELLVYSLIRWSLKGIFNNVIVDWGGLGEQECVDFGCGLVLFCGWKKWKVGKIQKNKGWCWVAQRGGLDTYLSSEDCWDCWESWDIVWRHHFGSSYWVSLGLLLQRWMVFCLYLFLCMLAGCVLCFCHCNSRSTNFSTFFVDRRSFNVGGGDYNKIGANHSTAQCDDFWHAPRITSPPKERHKRVWLCRRDHPILLARSTLPEDHPPPQREEQRNKGMMCYAALRVLCWCCVWCRVWTSDDDLTHWLSSNH